MKTSIRDELTSFLSDKKGIVLNDFIFNETYEPTIVSHREEEKSKIMNFFKSAKHGIDDSLDIIGSPGTGKTLLIKTISEEYQKIYPKTKIVYVYCADANNEPKALKSIAQSISGNKKVGRVSSEYLNTINESLVNFDRLIVVLDEIDKLLNMDGDNLLLNLIRIPHISIITISNEINWKTKIKDDRVIQRMIPNNVSFFPYQVSDLFNILKDRASKGLRDGSYDEGLLVRIAKEVCSTSNNTREAIKMLQRAAKHSEGLELDKISIDSLEFSRSKKEEDIVMDFIEHLQYSRKLCILAVYDFFVRKKEYPTAEEVKVQYNYIVENSSIESPVTIGTIQSYIRELLTLGILEKTNGRGLGRGRGREQERFKLKIDTEIYKNRVYSQVVKN